MNIFTTIFTMILLSTTALADSSDYTWVQYGENSKIIARSITPKNKCPKISIDGKNKEMLLRKQIDNEHVRVCEYDVTNSSLVKINGKQLKLPPVKATRFVVIGDTGCENSIFDPKHQKQKCDPKNWPFKQVADKVAKLDPDFVIHMGDYVYRDKYITAEDKIKNSQMQWYFFEQDFFEPAKELLEKAPMIFVRGNHESCKLAGDGWFSFLEPRSFAPCQDYTPSYKVNINDLNLIIFDSSGSTNGKDFSAGQLKKYEDDFTDIYQNIAHKHWLLIHQPVIPLKKLSNDETFIEKLHAIVIEKAFKNEYTTKIPFSLSGHYHVWALTERPRFTQMVVGNSGTRLHVASQDSYNIVSDDGKVKSIIKIRHGYTVFDRLEEHLWKATSYDIEGHILLVMNVASK